MALRKSSQAAKRAPAVGALVAAMGLTVIAEHTIVAGQFALNDVIEMLAIPAGHAVTGLKIVTDRIDSNGAPTLALDIGVMTGEWLQNTVDNDGTTARTVGTEYGSALTTVGRAAGGSVVTLDTVAGLQLAASNKDRSLGIKVQAAAATLVAGAKIRLIAHFVPVPIGMASGS